MSWPWFRRGFFSNDFDDDFFFRPFHTDIPSLTNDMQPFSGLQPRTSSNYQISEDKKKFELSVDLPGVKANDINIEVGNYGRIIQISGERKIHQGNKVSESRFEKSFNLDRNVDVRNITANLFDGVLIIKAPKIHEDPEKLTIPITK